MGVGAGKIQMSTKKKLYIIIGLILSGTFVAGVLCQEDTGPTMREGYSKREIGGITLVLPDDVKVYTVAGAIKTETPYEYTFRKVNDLNNRLEALEENYQNLKDQIEQLEKSGGNH